MTRPERLHLSNAALEQRALGLRAHGVLSGTDLLVVDAVAGRFGETDPEVLLGLAFAVRAPRVGDVGVHLPTIRERIDDEGSDSESPPTGEAAELAPEPGMPAGWPADPAQWEAAVLASPMTGEAADKELPFVRQALADGRTLVMTRRMWREQERLAAAARSLAADSPKLALSDRELATGLERLFGGAGHQGARAVATAAKRRLTVVTGGPGTGKTYSIKRLIALLLESCHDPSSPLRIELAAPTGKAAVRMADAIAEDLASLAVDDQVRGVLSKLRPRTLHKLLGMRPDGTSHHGTERPIAADLVVVDEASMVDLGLMRRLFEAIPAGARLVLLGDRDQLASVEAGTALADLVGPVLDRSSAQRGTLRDAVVPFDTNYRFKQAPTVAAIAAALQHRGNDRLEQVGRWMTGDELVAGEALPDRITHLGAPVSGRPAQAQLDRLAAPFLADDGFIGLLAAAIRAVGPEGEALRACSFHLSLLRALEGYRVLAVHRRGPLGVSGLEQAMGERCREALSQAIRDRADLPAEAPVKLPARSRHWLGRPVLITHNSYEVELMNGDIGLVLPTASGLAAVFPRRRDGIDTTREISLARLPDHAGALAMTVHKSQGSQFRRVAVVLAGRESPIQTRELVYTAITRTSCRLDWLGAPAELQSALRRRVGRASGLADLLWRGELGSDPAPKP